MKGTKCKSEGRLASSLFLLNARDNKILKIWYEDDWDVLTTTELLTDEINLYRYNPVGYVQRQIGLR